MAILGHFWTFLDILWAPPGQNGEKIDFFENTKNVENYPQNPSKNSLERIRMVLEGPRARNSQKSKLSINKHSKLIITSF